MKMSAAISNIAKGMVATMRNLIAATVMLRVAAAAHMAAIAGIASTVALAITINAQTGAIVKIRHVVKCSIAKTSATVTSISLVPIPGKNVLRILIARKGTRVTTRVTRTVLTQARVILVIVHMDRTPVVSMRIISRKVKKKEKSP
jgi:hypothetical protein